MMSTFSLAVIMDDQQPPEEAIIRLEQNVKSAFGSGTKIRVDDECINKDPIHVGYFTPFSSRLRDALTREGMRFDEVGTRSAPRAPLYIMTATRFKDLRGRRWIDRGVTKDEGFVKGFYRSHDRKAVLIYVTVNSRQEYLIALNQTDKERPYSFKKWFFSNPELFTETLFEEKMPITMMRYAFYRTEEKAISNESDQE